MVKILTAPNRYIQGSGVINDFAKYMAHLGSRPFILGGRTALSVIRESVEKSVSENGMECTFVEFTGKGTRQDTSELVSKATEFGGDVIVGIGGGLALDMAKAVVYEMNLPLVSVPTIASTDAPCSAEALQYLDNHQLDRVIILKKNPDVVLVDSKIIAEAPTRFFVAGMGDALATWFEARTCSRTGAKNFSGGAATATALAIARLAYDTLMEYGLAAKLAVDQNAATPAVEMVIEANTLLSGLGFENCGLGAAHSVSIGLGILAGTQNCLHGELVGFGTLVNLVIENYPKQEIKDIIEFFHAVGLPATLDQLGVEDTSPENLMKAAKITFEKESFMHHLAIETTPQLVVDSILAAHSLGLLYRPGH